MIDRRFLILTKQLWNKILLKQSKIILDENMIILAEQNYFFPVITYTYCQKYFISHVVIIFIILPLVLS